MSDEPSGSGDEWSSSGDDERGASDDDEWGDPDRIERPTEGDRTDRNEGDDGWDRIPIDLSGGSDDRDADDATEDDEYGPEASSTPIEGGDPDLENALFVVLGAVVMMLVIARLAMILV